MASALVPTLPFMISDYANKVLLALAIAGSRIYLYLSHPAHSAVAKARAGGVQPVPVRRHTVPAAIRHHVNVCSFTWDWSCEMHVIRNGTGRLHLTTLCVLHRAAVKHQQILQRDIRRR